MNSLPETRPLYQRLLSSIPFWVILYFVVRLIGITQPPAEVSHNWRQTTVCMAARNFLEVDANILYPRVDMAGNKSGITGMEFPLLNYLIYLMSIVFGYSHWYGRLINLIVTSIGIIYFAKTIKTLLNPKVALFATIVLLNSSWLIFGRKIMPDTFSLSLVFIGVFFGIRYLKGQNISHLIIYMIFVLAGCLVKLPAAIILAFLVPSFFTHRLFEKTKIVLAISTLITLLPVVWWYYLWVPYLVQNYEFWHFFMGVSISEGILHIAENLDKVFYHFYFSALKWVGFGLYIGGIILVIKKRNRVLLHIFGVSSVLLIILMSKAGYVFYIHDYYILPFVPMMATLAGYCLTIINHKSLQVALIILLIADGVGNQIHDWNIKDSYQYKLQLEAYADRISGSRELVAINSGGNPSDMYFAHRKGWMVESDFFDNPVQIDSLKNLGCKYLFVTRNVDLKYRGLENLTRVLDEEGVQIYSLKSSD